MLNIHSTQMNLKILYAEWTKPNKTEYILSDSTYTEF